VEWDETEIAWMRSLDHVRKTLDCPLCGLPKKICQAKENERRFKADADRCHVTVAIRRQQKNDSEAGIEHPDSLVYSATMRT
jgi:hypothetical protein